MRVLCRHGHYAFYPHVASEVARFASFYDLGMVRERDYYTYEDLAGLPNYSLKVKPYGNLPATKTYQGEPWEVMRENGFIFDLKTNLLLPKASITTIVDPALGDFFYWGETVMFQAGSITKTGQKILSFDAELDVVTWQLRIRSLEDE